ncbi:MAG: AMP-dependent synthetase and ligase [Phenylobacterium sp.]|nr:AMP-dependent synthetase and ligase [Phenylobacterium sp.]
MNQTTPGSEPAYRPLPIRQPKLSVEHRPDGSILMEQAYEMPPLWPSMPHLFQARAAEYPDRDFIAKREPLAGGGWGDWRRITFGEAWPKIRSLAQALIDRGLGPEASVIVLSGPSIEHALLMLACQTARAPFTPVSTGYSLAGKDFARLQHVVEVCRPRLAFADAGPTFAAALRHLTALGIEVVTATPVPGLETTAFADLLATAPGPAVDASLAAITPDTHAKTIFTSGSTGAPKGVIQTERMLTAVVAQHEALYIKDEAEEAPPSYLSWMPWSHVGGSNILFADVINEAATYYVDEGRPAPGQFEETLRNLREIRPREFVSPPIFLAYLASAMEAEPALRDRFFSRLRMLGYSTAGLSQDLFDRLQALAVAATGQRIPMITKYGSTETQGVTITPQPLEMTGPIGLPFPGITLKLAPVGDKLEIRARGPTVTPGYLRNSEATAAAFDEEGFYRTGDAARFVDPDDPSQGLAFDGRVSENFKLSSGTWVGVGNLRLALLEALAPLVEDCVVAGENRDFIGVLAWPRLRECAALVGGAADAATLLNSPQLRGELAERLARYNSNAGGSSLRVARLLLLDEPPVGEEIAEKGYINQRATLRRRAVHVERLYAKTPDGEVLESPGR